MLWFAVAALTTESFFYGRDVQPRDSHATVILKPHNYPAALRVQTRVIRCGD